MENIPKTFWKSCVLERRKYERKTQIKILIYIIIILSCVYLGFFANAIGTIKAQDNKINDLQDEITLKRIEIDSYKETIYQYQIKEEK